MTSPSRLIAIAILTAALTTTLRAESTPTLPDWDDRASVYLAMSQKAAADPQNNADRETKVADMQPINATPTVAGPSTNGIDDTTRQPPEQTPANPVDPSPGSPASPSTGRRHLAPPTERHLSLKNGTADETGESTSAASRRLAGYGLPMQSLYTILSALTIVIGAFLLFTWAMRRAGRMSARRSELPADVVSVLGRVPLAPRQFAELLRVGNKLVLVSLTATGAEPLTEVTDPAEIDRLVGLCQQNNPYSTTKAFEQVFQQMTSETAPAGFLGKESLLSSLASPAGAYRSNRGGSARA